MKHIKLTAFVDGANILGDDGDGCSACIHRPVCRILWHFWQTPAPEKGEVIVEFDCPFWQRYK